MKVVARLLQAMIFLFIISSLFPVHAEERYVEHNEFYTMYYDTEKVVYGHRGSQKSVEVWIKNVYTPAGVKMIIDMRRDSELSTAGYNKLSYSIQKSILVAPYKSKVVYVADYDENGVLLSLSELPESEREFRPIVPHSMLAELYDHFGNYLKK